MNGKIIIAEDDPVLREIYQKKFSLSGYEITACANGEEAMEAIGKGAPDVLILDINMPVMDGFDVLTHFPKDQRTFPVILLTNFGDESNRQRGEELGADDYFIKSEMTIRKLLEMVESMMMGRRYN